MRALIAVSLLLLAAGPVRAAEFLELTRLRLIDGSGAPERDVARLVARDGVIVAIDDTGTTPEAAAGDTWTRIDLDGAWVMPGLVDTHVHVARFSDTRAQAERILRQAVEGGITAVRDLAGDARTLAEIERASIAGEILAPTLVYSALIGGPAVHANGSKAQLSPGRAPGTAPWAREVARGADVPLVVAAARGTGAANLKLYGDLDRAFVRALAHEAKRQGLLSTAHATVFPARPSELVDAGVGSLAHAPYLVWEPVPEVPDDFNARTRGPWSTVAPDHPRLLALYREMARRGTFLDATLYVYRSMNSYSPRVQADWAEAAFRWGAEATRHAKNAGVRVTTGTDWFEPRGDELPHTHEELELLVEAAGFTPMEAIVAGTRHGAEALGIDARTGTVAVGKRADLLVLDADPSVDVRNTRRIRMTVLGGRIVRPAGHQ